MTSVRQALVRIVGGDATMQALCARADNVCLAWRSAWKSRALPLVAYWLADDGETGESGSHRLLILHLACLADEASGGIAKCESMTARLRQILTATAFDAQGLNAAPIGLLDESETTDLEEPTRERDLARKDLVLDLSVKLA